MIIDNISASKYVDKGINNILNTGRKEDNPHGQGSDNHCSLAHGLWGLRRTPETAQGSLLSPGVP